MKCRILALYQNVVIMDVKMPISLNWCAHRYSDEVPWGIDAYKVELGFMPKYINYRQSDFEIFLT